MAISDLLAQVRDCRECDQHLPLGPRPVLRASAKARVVMIGQAPGTKVHNSGVPWNDASGDRLRDWLVSRQRYWGVPIPVIYEDDDSVTLVDEGDLPAGATFGTSNVRAHASCGTT